MADEKLAAELKGNTFRVYWYLLQSPNSFSGPRKIQRELGFKSPALASYHLETLLELGIVEKNGGEYKVTEVVDVTVLKQYIKMGSFIVPRNITYATMFSILVLFFVSQFRDVTFYSLFALIFGVLSTVIFWYETFRVWRKRP